METVSSEDFLTHPLNVPEPVVAQRTYFLPEAADRMRLTQAGLRRRLSRGKEMGQKTGTPLYLQSGRGIRFLGADILDYSKLLTAGRFFVGSQAAYSLATDVLSAGQSALIREVGERGGTPDLNIVEAHRQLETLLERTGSLRPRNAEEEADRDTVVNLDRFFRQPGALEAFFLTEEVEVLLSMRRGTLKVRMARGRQKIGLAPRATVLPNFSPSYTRHRRTRSYKFSGTSLLEFLHAFPVASAFLGRPTTPDRPSPIFGLAERIVDLGIAHYKEFLHPAAPAGNLADYRRLLQLEKRLLVLLRIVQATPRVKIRSSFDPR